VSATVGRAGGSQRHRNHGWRQIQAISPNDVSFSAAWGETSPAVFERNLAASSFVHVIDQYIWSP